MRKTKVKYKGGFKERIYCPLCKCVFSTTSVSMYDGMKMPKVDERKVARNYLDKIGIKFFDIKDGNPLKGYLDDVLDNFSKLISKGSMNRYYGDVTKGYPDPAGQSFSAGPPGLDGDQEWMDFKYLLNSFGLDDPIGIIAERSGSIDIGYIFTLIHQELQEVFLKQFNELFPQERAEKLMKVTSKFFVQRQDG